MDLKCNLQHIDRTSHMGLTQQALLFEEETEQQHMIESGLCWDLLLYRALEKSYLRGVLTHAIVII